MKLKWFLITLFIVRVTIPGGLKVTYDNVESFQSDNNFYGLKLTNSKIVFVPIMWTIIEEK